MVKSQQFEVTYFTYGSQRLCFVLTIFLMANRIPKKSIAGDEGIFVNLIPALYMGKYLCFYL